MEGPWTTLRAHADDTALGNAANAEASWAVDNNLAFRCFRVEQTGANAYGNQHLFCGGIELYGELSEGPSEEITYLATSLSASLVPEQMISTESLKELVQVGCRTKGHVLGIRADTLGQLPAKAATEVAQYVDTQLERSANEAEAWDVQRAMDIYSGEQERARQQAEAEQERQFIP